MLVTSTFYFVDYLSISISILYSALILLFSNLSRLIRNKFISYLLYSNHNMLITPNCTFLFSQKMQGLSKMWWTRCHPVYWPSKPGWPITFWNWMRTRWKSSLSRPLVYGSPSTYQRIRTPERRRRSRSDHRWRKHQKFVILKWHLNYVSKYRSCHANHPWSDLR